MCFLIGCIVVQRTPAHSLEPMSEARAPVLATPSASPQSSSPSSGEGLLEPPTMLSPLLQSLEGSSMGTQSARVSSMAMTSLSELSISAAAEEALARRCDRAAKPAAMDTQFEPGAPLVLLCCRAWAPELWLLSPLMLVFSLMLQHLDHLLHPKSCRDLAATPAAQDSWLLQWFWRTFLRLLEELQRPASPEAGLALLASSPHLWSFPCSSQHWPCLTAPHCHGPCRPC